MKKYFNKKYLFAWTAIGFILGIILGFALPKLSIETKSVGDLYLNLIKMMIIPVIFCSVVSGIANIRNAASLKRIGIKTVAIYVILFVAAFIVSLGVAALMRPGANIVFDNPPEYVGELKSLTLADFLLSIIPDNPIKAMSESNIIGTISFAALFAIAMVAVKDAAKPVLSFINSLTAISFKMLDYIMAVTPIGVMSLMAFSVAQYGSGLFGALGKYILTAYIACIVCLFLVLYLPLFLITKIGPISFFKNMSKIWLVTLSTTSSAASLPTALQVSLEDFKADEDISRFVLPLGTTLSKVGGACSFACLALFVGNFYGIQYDLSTYLMIILVATLLNMAAPGIPGGGIVLGATFLSILGLPFHLMGPIAAFYRLLDMAFTSMNVTGNVTTNLIVSHRETKKANA